MGFARIDGGHASGVNLNAYAVVAILNPPLAGSVQYKLVIRFANLGTDHHVAVRSTRDAVVYVEDQAPNSETTDVIEWGEISNSTDPAEEVAVIDTAGLSPAASYEWDLYSDTVNWGQPVPGDPSLGAQGLYADELDLDDLRGSDNIDSWSDLNNTGARNHDRIQRMFNATDAAIQKALERVYTFPLTLSTVDAQILNTWSSVLTAYLLYTTRGVTSNTTTGRAINPYKTEMQEVLDDIWLYQNNKQTLHHSKRSGSSTRATTGTVLATGTALDRRNHGSELWTNLFTCRYF